MNRDSFIKLPSGHTVSHVTHHDGYFLGWSPSGALLKAVATNADPRLCDWRSIALGFRSA